MRVAFSHQSAIVSLPLLVCACVQSFFSLGRVLIDTPLAFAICYVAAHAAFMTRSDAPLCVRCILIVVLLMATSRALNGVVL